MGRRRKSNKVRFLALVGPEEKFLRPGMKTPCTPWGGKQHPRGYGLFKTRVKNCTADSGRKARLAHRFAFKLVHGRYPRKGFYVCHKCNNRLCVRIGHLYEGTAQQNSDDMIRASRQSKGAHHAKITRQGFKRVGFPVVTVRQRQIARSLRRYGLILSEIAKLVGISYSSVQHACLAIKVY